MSKAFQFTDFFSVPLEVGDKVLHTYSGQGSRRIYHVQAEIKAFTRECVVLTLGEHWLGKHYTKTVRCRSLIKMFDKNGVEVYKHRGNGNRN